MPSPIHMTFVNYEIRLEIEDTPLSTVVKVPFFNVKTFFLDEVV